MGWKNSNEKHVPTSVRRTVLERDGHQCTATGRDGERCPQVTQLEAHHLDRYALGETTHPDQLVTLCHWHHMRITQRQAAEARRANPTPTTRRPPERHPGLT